MENIKRVLLFSAGMDSFIIKELYSILNSECLFINLGTKENRLEQITIQQYYPDVQFSSLPLSDFELPNKIIPFRNHHLTLLAANYGNHIYFGFTAGDSTKDKDHVFAAQMSSILNYFSLDTNKVKQQGPFVLHIPGKAYTKAELVKAYIDVKIHSIKYTNAVDKLLYHTVSCYEPYMQMKPCGKCRSCLRKYVAFKVNKLDFPSDYFENDPEEYLDNFYRESIQKKRSLKELKEIELCLNQK